MGREYDLGYEEMRSANPGVDQWLPGEGTPIYLPTQSILPDAEHKGIVINVPAMRLYYFTTEKSPGTPDKSAGTPEKPAASPVAVTTVVTTYPIGIGAEGWATPFGEAKVTQKARDPAWYVPASVRKEHLERGDKLPRVVPPGPDNPLGAFAMTLSHPELPDPRHEQARRRRHALEPRLHSPVSRGHRSAVRPRAEGHAGAHREPAVARSLARRAAVSRGASAARGGEARSRGRSAKRR